MVDSIAAAQLRSYVDRVLRLKEEIAALNADVSEVYKEAKGNGLDKKALQATVKRAGLPREDVQEQDTLLDLYWRAYTGDAEPSRARACTREGPAPTAQERVEHDRGDRYTVAVTPHDPDTGEVVEPEPVEEIPSASAVEPQKPAAPVVEANACTTAPIPVQSHIIRDAGEPREMPDVPAFLRRTMQREAAE